MTTPMQPVTLPLTAEDLDHIEFSADCVDDEGMVLVSDRHFQTLISQAHAAQTLLEREEKRGKQGCWQIGCPADRMVAALANAPDESRLYNATETADFAGIPYDTFRRMVRDGHISASDTDPVSRKRGWSLADALLLRGDWMRYQHLRRRFYGGAA